MSYAGERRALAVSTVRRAVALVFAGEGEDDVSVGVTFLSSGRMRGLNRRTFARDRATDVIAFGMRHDGTLVADIYVCPPVARRSAGERGIPVREELARLVIHGLLHASGHDHPLGQGRMRSVMWKLQEYYLSQLLRRDG